MEILAHLIKMIVIFLGGGLLSLLALWIGQETSLITKTFIETKIFRGKNKVLLQQSEKVSAQSGLYKLLLPGGVILDIFSTHKGMRILKE